MNNSENRLTICKGVSYNYKCKKQRNKRVDKIYKFNFRKRENYG